MLKIKHFNRTNLCLSFLLLIQYLPVSAQPLESRVSGQDDSFTLENPFELNLEFDVKSFIKNKDTEEYVDARISYYLPDSTFMEKTVLIKPRGNFRLNKCYLPPIKIKFNDTDYGIEAFNSMGSTKMVSLCKQAGNFEQYLIKEYLIYKAYEYISEYSLDTYLLKVNFIDSEDKKKPFSSYSFLIEDIDDLASRKNAIKIDNQGLLPVHMERSVMNPLGVFQFMIGNTDWHVPNLHNIKLLKINDVDWPKPIPVPYDFDYAGIVNANYAIPHESLPISSITERYYMGNCMSDEEFEEVRKVFLENKENILNLFGNCELLQSFNSNSSVRYLEDFFEILSNDNLADKWIFDKCK